MPLWPGCNEVNSREGSETYTHPVLLLSLSRLQ